MARMAIPAIPPTTPPTITPTEVGCVVVMGVVVEEGAVVVVITPELDSPVLGVMVM